MIQALALYRRLGFVLPPPSYPTMAAQEGAAPRPFGAANTHADFPRNFFELTTSVKDADRIPSDAHLVALQAPADLLPRLVQRISNTSANLAACLERFEGLHIVMFEASDIDAAATRLSTAGVGHGGVDAVQRPVQTHNGRQWELVRFLEIDSDAPGAKPGRVDEGRIGIAATPEAQGARRLLDHPNGAVALVDVMLCVADPELAPLQGRYENYLDRPARSDGLARIFDLDDAWLTLVPESGLATLLPGERPAAQTLPPLMPNGHPTAHTA